MDKYRNNRIRVKFVLTDLKTESLGNFYIIDEDKETLIECLPETNPSYFFEVIQTLSSDFFS